MAMFALILMKKVYLNKDEESEQDMMRNKDNTLTLFYIPFYAAYLGISLYERYTATSAK